jgi:hypothetical protein
MNIRSELYLNEDPQGNKVYLRVFYDETNTSQNAVIHLRLKGENRPRQLGTLIFSTRTFFCKRNSTKHYHYKTKGYGFNWTILNDPHLSIEKIHMVLDEKEHFIFEKSLIETYGKFLNFKQQGFELQRFMPIEIIREHSKKQVV